MEVVWTLQEKKYKVGYKLISKNPVCCEQEIKMIYIIIGLLGDEKYSDARVIVSGGWTNLISVIYYIVTLICVL